MIKAQDAIRIARSLLGTPYSELDCINLIKKVIRSAPGGVKSYTTAGTNALWRSMEMSAKYRDLTQRQDGLTGAQAGMLAFKADGEDWHHVGIVTGEGTVIHSSSTQGGRGVVETPLTEREGWTHLAVHRYIETSSVSPSASHLPLTGEGEPHPSLRDTFPKGEGLGEREESKMTLYRATVITERDPLNVRESPKTGRILGRLNPGAVVGVVSEDKDGWVRIQYNELVGYVASEYLAKAQEEAQAPEETREENIIRVSPDITIIDSAGNRFKPVGSWRVLIGSVD